MPKHVKPGLNRIFMSPLELKLLENIGLNKYASLSYLHHCYPQSSRQTLAKTLKKLLDKKIVGRELAFEPAIKNKEFIYYLKNSNELIHFSNKFSSLKDIQVAKSRSHSHIVHDAAISWFRFYIERERDKFLHSLIDELNFESRRNRIKSMFVGPFIADGILRIKHYENNAKIFALEMDNVSESDRVIAQKMKAYEDFLASKNNYLIVVVTKTDEKRLRELLEIGYKVTQKNDKIFGCCLSELELGIFSNIWGTRNTLQKHCVREFLPL